MSNKDQSQDSWVLDEFGDADLGDDRRTARLIEIATSLSQKPTASLPAAMTNSAKLKGAYRFFSNKEINSEDILQPHLESTINRISKSKTVLAINDTSELDYSSHPAKKDIGYLSGDRTRGLLMHSVFPITPDRVPLGLLHLDVWARDDDAKDKERNIFKLPIEKKESHKWIRSFDTVNEVAFHLKETLFICVGDRESDVYDLFMKERSPNVEILVRASWNRCVDHEERYLWEMVASQPVVGTHKINVPKRSKRKTATLEIRFCEVTLMPPKYRRGQKLPKIKLHAVSAVEKSPPKKEERLEWLLLTTKEITNVEEAIEITQWYSNRFLIEVFHKVLKSGCKIEELQLDSGEDIKRALPIYCAVAWRILYASLLSRSLPDACCTLLLRKEEWEALYCTINYNPHPPKTPYKLKEAVINIAKLGGFLARKRDGHPGPTALWIGFQRLVDLTFMYTVMTTGSQKHPLQE